MKREKLYEKTIAIIAAVAVIVSSTLTAVQTYRLERYRHELDNVRAELSAANDRYDDIEAVVDRTGTILSQSVITVADLRRQIAEVREVFEEMESILNSSNFSDSCDSDNDNLEEQQQ